MLINENQLWVHTECNPRILNPTLIFDPHNPGTGNIHFHYSLEASVCNVQDTGTAVIGRYIAQRRQLQGRYSRTPSRCEDVGHGRRGRAVSHRLSVNTGMTASHHRRPTENQW